MSVAVTSVVVPSRRLRFLLAAFGLSLFAAAAAVGWLLPGRFTSPLAALPPLLAGLALCHAAWVGPAPLEARGRRRPALRGIDISGVGRVRLTVQQDLRPPIGVPAAALPGATVWPACMLLHLRPVAEAGACAGAEGEAQGGAGRDMEGGAPGAQAVAWRLVLLPDNVAPQAYRRLAVALRAQAARASAAGPGLDMKIL